MKNKVLIILTCIFITSCASKKKIMVDAIMVTPTPSIDANLLVETPKPTTIPENSSIDTQGKEVLEIKEKLFITQINDIFYNFDDYKDKIIVIEGMYSEFTSLDGKSKSPVVFRFGPGCCNNDGWGGFLLKNYEGEKPKDKEWIKVIGTPLLVENGVYKDLFLEVISLEILSERGAETVNS